MSGCVYIVYTCTLLQTCTCWYCTEGYINESNLPCTYVPYIQRVHQGVPIWSYSGTIYHTIIIMVHQRAYEDAVPIWSYKLRELYHTTSIKVNI